MGSNNSKCGTSTRQKIPGVSIRQTYKPGTGEAIPPGNMYDKNTVF